MVTVNNISSTKDQVLINKLKHLFYIRHYKDHSIIYNFESVYRNFENNIDNIIEYLKTLNNVSCIIQMNYKENTNFIPLLLKAGFEEKISFNNEKTNNELTFYIKK